MRLIEELIETNGKFTMMNGILFCQQLIMYWKQKILFSNEDYLKTNKYIKSIIKRYHKKISDNKYIDYFKFLFF